MKFIFTKKSQTPECNRLLVSFKVNRIILIHAIPNVLCGIKKAAICFYPLDKTGIIIIILSFNWCSCFRYTHSFIILHKQVGMKRDNIFSYGRLQFLRPQLLGKSQKINRLWSNQGNEQVSLSRHHSAGSKAPEKFPAQLVVWSVISLVSFCWNQISSLSSQNDLNMSS